MFIMSKIPGVSTCCFNHLDASHYNIEFSYFNGADMHARYNNLSPDIPERSFELDVSTICDNIPIQDITYNLLKVFKTSKDIDRCVEWLDYICFHYDYDGNTIMQEFIDYESDDSRMIMRFLVNLYYPDGIDHRSTSNLVTGITIQIKNNLYYIETANDADIKVDHMINLDKKEAITLLDYFKTVQSDWGEDPV